MIECVLQIICGWTVRTSVDKVGIVAFQFVYVYSTFKEKKKRGSKAKEGWSRGLCVCACDREGESVCQERIEAPIRRAQQGAGKGAEKEG